MLIPFGIIISVICFCVFKLLHLNVLKMFWLIIIRNLYSPNWTIRLRLNLLPFRMYLPTLHSGVIAGTSTSEDTYINKYQMDRTLKNVDDGERIKDWWGPIIDQGKYAVISRMVTVCLSCFHGPMVESLFNLMSDIIDIRSTRMNIATFCAIQTVKYGLISRKMTALEYFRKGDVKHDCCGCTNLLWSREMRP